MGKLEKIKADVLANATAEVKHAFLIWDEPPPEAIAKAVLISASKMLLESVYDLVSPDDLPEDAFNIACKMLDQTYKKQIKVLDENRLIDPDNDNIFTRPN
jgi:hypothetical protein